MGIAGVAVERVGVEELLLPSLEVIAVSQAVSPESNPNSPHPS